MHLAEWIRLQQLHEEDRHRCEVEWCVSNGAIWWHKWQTTGQPLAKARGPEAAQKLIEAVKAAGNKGRNAGSR
jgi:hypothetical protein